MKKIILSLAFICFLAPHALAQWHYPETEERVNEKFQKLAEKVEKRQNIRPEMKELLKKQLAAAKQAILKSVKEMQAMREKFKNEREELRKKLNMTEEEMKPVEKLNEKKAKKKKAEGGDQNAGKKTKKALKKDKDADSQQGQDSQKQQNQNSQK